MKGSGVITIKLDVPYQMTVGGAFVKTCGRGRVYITRYVITRFSRGPIIMESQCIQPEDVHEGKMSRKIIICA